MANETYPSTTSGPLSKMLQATSIFYGGIDAASPFSDGPPRAGATEAFANSQSASAAEEAPEVFLGTEPVEVRTGHPTAGQTNMVKSDLTGDPMELMEEFSKASPQEQRKMALLLSLGGFAGEGSFEKLIIESLDMTLGDTIDAYDKLLYEAYVQYKANKNKITPDQLLRRAIAYKMPSSSGWDGTLDGVGSALNNLGINIDGITEGENADAIITGDEEESSTDSVARKPKPFVGTKTTTSTSTVRDVMDPADAKALTRAMLQNELGRDPTEEEFEDFIGAVQYAQRTNPSKSTTTNSYRYEKDKFSPGGSRMVEQSSNTVSRSGITSQGIADIALEKARQNPNWAEWQAMGTYAPALFEALGSTVPGR